MSLRDSHGSPIRHPPSHSGAGSRKIGARPSARTMQNVKVHLPQPIAPGNPKDRGVGGWGCSVPGTSTASRNATAGRRAMSPLYAPRGLHGASALPAFEARPSLAPPFLGAQERWKKTIKESGCRQHEGMGGASPCNPSTDLFTNSSPTASRPTPQPARSPARQRSGHG